MKRRFAKAAAVLIAIAAASCATSHGRDTVDVAIRGVTIVSAERSAPLENVDVLINNGRIVAIGSALNWPATLEIDGAGRFLTPGLIDGHVHLYHATGLNRRYTSSFDELYAAFQAQQPRSYLYFGYTTVVELNADIEANRRFEAAPLQPDLIHCGQGLVLSNDFMATDFEDEAEFLAAFPNFLHDRFTTPALPEGFDPAEHTPAATVSRIAESGGRCVKMYYEEALWWPADSRPNFALPSEAIVREVVVEAHARGMPVLLHGTTPSAYRFAAATGIDVMAHGLWDWNGAHLGQDEIPNSATLAIEDAVRAGVHVQPTMQTVANTLSMFQPELLNDAQLQNVLPAEYLVYLRTDAQRGRDAFLSRNGPILAEAYERGAATSADPGVIAATYFERMQRLVSAMDERGVPFAFGTDTAVGGPGWGNPPGLNGYWEMRDWAQAGVSPEAIFRAATLNNARVFGLEDDVGTVEVGKRANLLLMSQNPIENVAAYDSIDLVVLNGRVIDRRSLAADARERD